MKRISFAVTALVILLALGACGGAAQEKDAEGFPLAETLVADSIAIDEILEVNGMALCRDYAAIYSPKTSKVLFRYRLPNWEFADSSLVTGEGPDDLTQAYLLYNSKPADVLWVSEPNRQKFSRYDLSGSTVRRMKTVPGTSNDWIFNGLVNGDTLLVYGKLDFSDGEYYMYTTRLADSLRNMDTLRGFAKSEIKTMDYPGGGISKSARIYNAPSMEMAGDRLATWYSQMGSMVVYRIGQDGHFQLEKSFGEPISYEKVKNTDFEGQKKTFTEDLATVSDDYIYMLRKQYDRVPDEKPNPDNPRKVEALEIKVYDWDMNPVKKYSLDKKDATEILIDELHGKIYAYDRRLDFEQVYTYDYQL